MRAWILALAFAAPALADTVICKDGRKIEGRILEDTEHGVKLEVRHGSVTIPRHQIRSVERGATSEEVYRERSARIAPGDVKAMLDLARWCDEQKLRKEATAEYQRVIAADPENEKARTALGHVRHEGVWMTFEDSARAKGLVEFGGQWMPPEQARVKQALKEQKELEQAIAERVRDSFRKLSSADIEARARARELLDGIPADYKYLPILENLENRSADVRAYCVGALGPFDRPEAMAKLARRVLLDESAVIRDAATEMLRTWNRPDTWIQIQKGLQSDSAAVRIRAAQALVVFPNEGAAEALISALAKAGQPRGGFSVERRDPDPRYAGGANLTPEARKALEDAGKLPSGGMNPLGSPDDDAKKEALEKELTAYGRALEACTGLSHGRNLDAWRDWWLRKHAASSGGGAQPADPEPVAPK
ncbi:MAG: hypothetical protein HUU15_15945 [Candidatus Brocadiae bacterium]|nr:hypothetical protein [Candidatus Brocadiia bacterium]